MENSNGVRVSVTLLCLLCSASIVAVLVVLRHSVSSSSRMLHFYGTRKLDYVEATSSWRMVQLQRNVISSSDHARAVSFASTNLSSVDEELDLILRKSRPSIVSPDLPK